MQAYTFTEKWIPSKVLFKSLMWRFSPVAYFLDKERKPLKIDFEEIQLAEIETTILSCSEKLCENPV